ncbi:hypothetical protein Cni_G21231 [Canna indica]|uniref:Uncharacterized protein n=1 Tax=Canna indica TaxID=4628 RepID=A0AAQ3QIH1_9LILI|nr:hypothetical protein Cni_G21231 [Canna indica]
MDTKERQTDLSLPSEIEAIEENGLRGAKTGPTSGVTTQLQYNIHILTPTELH